MPATIALIKAYFEGADRLRALSYWSIGSWGGSGLCSFAGGAIATYMGWKWIFIISTFGWTSIYSLGLMAITVIGAVIFFKIVSSKEHGFIDFSLFKKMP